MAVIVREIFADTFLGLATAIVLASSVGYAKSFPTVASRQTLAHSFGGNAGIAALIGPARGIGDDGVRVDGRVAHDSKDCWGQTYV